MDGSSSGIQPALSTADLAARITGLAGHLDAADRRWLALIAEFDRRHGWRLGSRAGDARHVAHSALRRREPGRCEFEHGPAIPVESARRFACDASVVSVVEDGKGEPLDVGRRTRSIPPVLRRALNARDRGCRFPGCTRSRYVDGHAVRQRADGGETKLSNLVSMCRFHNRQVHEGRIAVHRLDDAGWRFVKPDGEACVSSAPGHTRPLTLRATSPVAACDGTETDTFQPRSCLPS